MTGAAPAVQEAAGPRGEAEAAQQSDSSGPGPQQQPPPPPRSGDHHDGGAADISREAAAAPGFFSWTKNKRLDDSLEDGDLPALKKGEGAGIGRLIHGKRTAAKPLQSPSQAGLPSPDAGSGTTDLVMRQQQRQFWAQLEVSPDDDDGDEDEDDDPAVEEREQRTYDNYAPGVSLDSLGQDDGPEDELRARRGGTHEATLQAPRRRDETEEYLAATASAADDAGATPIDLCGATLTALGNMCGAGLALALGSPDRVPLQDHSGRTQRPIVSEKQEEQTAIEVEFVDPLPAVKKNVFLSAVQRKTNEEYERMLQQERRRLHPTHRQQRSMADDDEDDDDAEDAVVTDYDDDELPDDEAEDEAAAALAKASGSAGSEIYRSFSVSEKRKFLKLINSGVSPPDASNQILMDRNNKANKDKSSPVESKKKASTKAISKLAFWKKMTAMHQNEKPSRTHEARALPRQKQTQGVERQYQQPARTAYYLDDLELQQESTGDPIEEIERQEVLAASEIADGRFRDEKKFDQTPPRVSDGSTKVPRAVDSGMISPPSEVSSSAVVPFAKSGIDYYDGVRRDDDDDDSAIMLTNSSSSKPRNVASRALSRFADRSKSAPRSRLDDEFSKQGVSPKDFESFNAGILATSEAQTQRDLQERSHAPVVVTPDDMKSKPRAAADDLDDLVESPVPVKRLDPTNSAQPREAEPVIHNATVERTAKAENFDPIETQAPAKHRATIQLDALDVNMSTYMHASEAFNTPSGMQVGGHPQDNASVYTMGTAVTGMSAVTMSTRSRRPGAAKSRLEREKRAQMINSHKKGWHETMKAVSEATNRHWDPVRGWIDFDDHDAMSAELEDIATGPDETAGKMHLNLDLHKKQSAEERNGTNEPVTVPVAPASETTGKTDSSAQTPLWHGDDHDVVDASVQTDESPRGVQSSSDKLSSWVKKHELNSRNISDPSIESSMMAVVSQENENTYVQIGDNGVVRSKTPPSRLTPPSQATSLVSNTRTDKLKGDQDVPASSFPSAENRNLSGVASPVTFVVKQKIDAEDFGLFPDEKPRLLQSRESNELRVFHHEDAKSIMSGPRRTVEPIDIDDINQSWDQEDGAPVAPQWESKKATPLETSSEVGSHIVASSSMGSKRIPKLKGSKRDTSPINSRKAFGRRGNALALDSPPPTATQNDFDEPYDSRNQERSQAPQVTSTFEQLLEIAEVEEVRLSPAMKPVAIAREKNLVKERLKQWESRTGLHEQKTPENALASDEWRSFLGKQAARQQEAMFAQGADPVTKITSRRDIESEVTETPILSGNSVFEDLSDKHGVRNDPQMSRSAVPDLPSDEFEPATSEYGPAEGDRASFFKRFVECTAPIRAECKAVGATVQTTVQEMQESDSLPMAHLAFLRSNPHAQVMRTASGRFVPPAFCGRPDNVVVEDEVIESAVKVTRPEPSTPPTRPASSTQHRSHSAQRALPGNRGNPSFASSGSSVVSADGFGAKTAYLEALALKGAVSGSKRSSSRLRGAKSSASSATSSASSAHSEKWKSFLEKKKLRAGVSPARSVTKESEVSKAAERFAANKLEEIMSKRAQSKQDAAEAAAQMGTNIGSSSGKAADELAAARVEAMMAALTGTDEMDEGEI